jgi:hypothetical protein
MQTVLTEFSSVYQQPTVSPWRFKLHVFRVLHSTNISPLICVIHSRQHTPMAAVSCFTDRVTTVCSLAILSVLICLVCRRIISASHYVTYILSSDTLALIMHTASQNRVLASSRPVTYRPVSRVSTILQPTPASFYGVV